MTVLRFGCSVCKQMGFIVCETVIASQAVSQINESRINIFYNIFYLADIDITQNSCFFGRLQIQGTALSVLCQSCQNLVSPSGNQKLI